MQNPRVGEKTLTPDKASQPEILMSGLQVCLSLSHDNPTHSSTFCLAFVFPRRFLLFRALLLVEIFMQRNITYLIK